MRQGRAFGDRPNGTSFRTCHEFLESYQYIKQPQALLDNEFLHTDKCALITEDRGKYPKIVAVAHASGCFPGLTVRRLANLFKQCTCHPTLCYFRGHGPEWGSESPPCYSAGLEAARSLANVAKQCHLGGWGRSQKVPFCTHHPSFYCALKLAQKTQVSVVPLEQPRWAIKNARKKWMPKSPCLSEGRVLPNHTSNHIFSSPDGCLLSKSDGHRDKGTASALSNCWSFTLKDYLLGVTNVKNALSNNSLLAFIFFKG